MDRRSFVRTLALAGAGALAPAELLAAAGRLSAAAAPVTGMNSHLLTPEAIAQLRDLGIRHVRTTGILQFWEGEIPAYAKSMQEASARAADAGLRVLWVLHNTRGEVFHSRVDRRLWDRMTAFAAWTARLPACEGVQLWNEQDVWVQAPFGAGTGLDPRRTGRNYAEHLRLAYPRIREANPDVRVVSGGTADHPDERWRGFLRGVMDEPPPVDAVGVHAYGPWPRARSIVAEARGIVAGHAPLWLTEFGNDRPRAFRADRQEEIWRGVIEGNEREALAARVYPYCLQTDPNDPGHGLFDLDGGTRPAYRWLRAHRRAEARSR